MNNYGFLAKSELRYLIKYDNRLSAGLQRELSEYATVNKVKLERWSVSSEEWNLVDKRIDLNEEESRLRLKKKRSAKQADLRGLLFVIFIIAVIVLFSIYRLAEKGIEGYESILAIVFLPVGALMLTELVKRYKQGQSDLSIERSLEINSKNACFWENGQQVTGGRITGIRYYWEEGSEAGDDPSVTVDIDLENGKVLRVDENGSYKELLYLVDKLATSAGVKLMFVNRSAPTSYANKL